MILGKIIGKTSTQGFDFLVEKNAKKFEYVQVPIKEIGDGKDEVKYVLCQIVELEQTDQIIAKCIAIGHKEPDGKIRLPRVPFIPGTEVLKADDPFIKRIIQLDSEKGAYVGKLEGKDINIHLDLGKILNKHIAVLAKSGAGKSYTVGVLLEEILEKKVPLLIIDPHGEYGQIKYPNEDAEEKKLFSKFGIESKTYIKQIREYGDIEVNPEVRPLKLSERMSVHEISHILPGKLNANQLACIYAAMKNLDTCDLENLQLELEVQDSNIKWTLIDNIDYLKKLNIFSPSPTPIDELVKPGMCSIINLKGTEPEVGEIIVYKLLKDLFAARKRNIVPPFFVVIEEAHNFAPERSFGETKCSKILRTIASEGRKFGLGLCVVSQRPARVDKSVLSQCSTQIILKVSNPNDLRAISSSVEGITSESEAEIKNLPIGTALITGVVEMPLFVNIRPRRTKHGGVSVKMVEEEKDFFDETKTHEETKLLPLVFPKTSKKDMQLMSDTPIKEIKTYLVPSAMASCTKAGKKYELLVELTQGKIITDPEKEQYIDIPNLGQLSPLQMQFIEAGSKLKEFELSQIMETTKMNFTRSQEMLLTLSKLGYLENKGGKYSLSSSLILDLEQASFYGRIEYGKIDHEMMLDANFSKETIKKRLNPLTDVNDIRDCYIVWYKPVY